MPEASPLYSGESSTSGNPLYSSDDKSFHIPKPHGGELLLSRRNFLFGVAGLAAIGVGTAVGVNVLTNNDSDDLDVLTVSENAVAVSDNGTEINASDCVSEVTSAELPYGTLVWANDNDIAACLIPTEKSNPIAQVALLSLDSGEYNVVLKQAVNSKEGFEIYDVRATSDGIIWTEANILEGTWRVYTSFMSGSSMSKPVMAEQGDINWQMPTLAAVGEHMYWQVLPNLEGEYATESSLLRGTIAGSDDVTTIYVSEGRMSTPPYGLADAVVITPRTDTSTVHYQLTLIEAESNKILDTMVLPASMHPLEAGYGNTGFMFSFEEIYSYGDGIANLGTYAPATEVTDGNYSDAPWFRFARNPTAAPCWCGDYFIVKSTSSVCGVKTDKNEYFALDVESGADDYGEYLASTGMRNTMVTYANINDNPVNGSKRQCCLVKVWKTV